MRVLVGVVCFLALCSLTSRVDILRDRAGAHEMVAWFAREVKGQSQLGGAPRRIGLGDAGLLYGLRRGEGASNDARAAPAAADVGGAALS